MSKPDSPTHTPATPVAREGARAHARKFAHEHLDCLGGTLFPQSRSTRYSHDEACDRLTAAIETRDASAVEVERKAVEFERAWARVAVEAAKADAEEVERVYREALEAIGGRANKERTCLVCLHWQPECDDYVINPHHHVDGCGHQPCRGGLARAALARVASLKGGMGR